MSSSVQDDGGVLTSLRYYHAAAAAAADDFERHGNVDTITTTTTANETASKSSWARCHVSATIPFSQEGAWNAVAYENSVGVALALHHLNTGNGTIVPQIAGLHDRCPLRFTLGAANTDYNPGRGLKEVIAQTSLSRNNPCAFVGAYRSGVSMPTSLVTGLLGYMQISPSSTSTDLEDKTQFPLFGRTVPPDSGNAVPAVLYVRNFLQARHLAVINENDPYGNAYAEAMRRAARAFTPDLTVRAIALDDNSQESIDAAIRILKETGYRFVFGVILTPATQDAVMKTAYEQGVAGTGLHNWLYGDSFQLLERRTLPKDAALHLAYRGVGVISWTGGIPGVPKYDKFTQHLAAVANPSDITYLENEVWPQSPALSLNSVRGNPNFLKVLNKRSPFAYEAAIAVGLSACRALEQHESHSDDEGNYYSLDGVQQYSALRNLTFEGIGGEVRFDPETGSRLPENVMYKVENYVQREVTEDVVAFEPVTASLFQNAEWTALTDYVFNDGTTNLPVDLAPISVDDASSTDNLLPFLVAFGGAGLVVLVFTFWLIRYQGKRSNDVLWEVNPSDLVFDDPPEILGRGTFGLVLGAEYRGTQVAVKRVIPPRSDLRSSTLKLSSLTTSMQKGGNKDKSGTKISECMSQALNTIDEEEMDASSNNWGTNSRLGSCTRLGSYADRGAGLQSSGFGNSLLAKESSANGGILSSANNTLPQSSKQLAKTYEKLKEDFREEMRHLAKLRHPCVTTVMGAVINRHEDPLLIMELMDYGSLFDLLHNHTLAIDGEIVLPVLRDISQGMRFLHSASPTVVHGDLKAANILVDNRFRAKVSDFGLSQKRNLGGTGTPFWMAPELLRRESSNTPKSDVYSFGVILYELYSRKVPYDGENAQDVLAAVADKEVRKRVPAPSNMPVLIQSLMEECHDDNPEVRPSFEEIDFRLKRVGTDNVMLVERPNIMSHTTLFDMFPRDVAEALRDGRKVEPRHCEVVTIFFSDVVGFTDISATLTPAKVANMLDRLYNRFDNLTVKHDVYKVDTIGDAFIAASNLIKDQLDDHCKRIAEFSIDAVKAANETLVDEDDYSKGCVNIRVGFHSGSVVADVVGNRSPRYTLFGDAMNTASRMESNSKVNRINCSITAAEILRKQMPDIPMKSRGEIQIKGKGPMCCYWVNEGSSKEEIVKTPDSTLEAIEQVRLMNREDGPGLGRESVRMPSFRRLGSQRNGSDSEVQQNSMFSLPSFRRQTSQRSNIDFNRSLPSLRRLRDHEDSTSRRNFGRATSGSPSFMNRFVGTSSKQLQGDSLTSKERADVEDGMVSGTQQDKVRAEGLL